MANKYEPTPADLQTAEGMMTRDEKIDSKEREMNIHDGQRMFNGKSDFEVLDFAKQALTKLRDDQEEGGKRAMMANIDIALIELKRRIMEKS